jgi:rod shape-determining protein MreB and related proteins
MLSTLSSLLRCDLAIDLGTAATRVAQPGDGIVLDEPSVVAVARTTNRILSSGCAVGHLARQMQGRTPDSVNVVRPLSSGVVTDFKLCEAMLRYFLRKVRPSRFGLRPRLLIAAPSGLTPVEKRALLTSAHRAGAGQVLLIGVAHAAALGVGLPVAEPVASMVIDVGAGATEVAVLSLGDIVARHAVRVGGDQMDQAIVDFLRRTRGLRIGLSTAEQLRIDLGCTWPTVDESETAQPDQTTRLPDSQTPSSDVRGIDVATGMPRRIDIDSREIGAALVEPLEKIAGCIRATLDQCSPDLVADLVDRGVVLCGGGSLLRGLCEWLQCRTGLPIRVADEPLTAVVRGTLICLEHLDSWGCLLETSNAEG